MVGDRALQGFNVKHLEHQITIILMLLSSIISNNMVYLLPMREDRNDPRCTDKEAEAYPSGHSFQVSSPRAAPAKVPLNTD